MHDAASLEWTSARPDPRETASTRGLERLVGRSLAMTALREKLRRVAASDASVLVSGPSGTGKELAAQLVHALSPRSRGPFVPVDCGALSEGVLESELFGHARGAFTSAAQERRGLFEEAHGGTLFLDEIANTTLQLQARLLRVLQEREVRRVGCNRARAVDVRIVAATNADLSEAVEARRFREDLLYRLDVLQLRLPSLSERRDDVPLLAAHVLAELSVRSGVAYRLGASATGALLAHSWPGNVRELRNVLERAAAFSVDGRIEAEHLPERFAAAPGPCRAPSLADLVSGFERTMLRERLLANGWNRTRTARELGITRRCLFNKITKHVLQP